VHLSFPAMQSSSHEHLADMRPYYVFKSTERYLRFSGHPELAIDY
jgi:hypothetical protein